MKIPSIIVCVLLLVGCGCSHHTATLTINQAMESAKKVLPPLSQRDAYAANFKDGVWQVYLLKNARYTNISHVVLVASVRDSDGTVEIVK